MSMKNIAIDFDGTIHDFAHPVPGRKMGPPMEGAQAALEQLQTDGYNIIVFCRWATNEYNCKVIADWMRYFEMPFVDVTNIKPDAVAYIDDRGIRFTGDWKATIQAFEDSL